MIEKKNQDMLLKILFKETIDFPQYFLSEDNDAILLFLRKDFKDNNFMTRVTLKKVLQNADIRSKLILIVCIS